MDRFESKDVFNGLIELQRVYIPIWIDLKVKANETSTPQLFIYIPIWIDLKV